jgi:hypothetical protein
MAIDIAPDWRTFLAGARLDLQPMSTVFEPERTKAAL